LLFDGLESVGRRGGNSSPSRGIRGRQVDALEHDRGARSCRCDDRDRRHLAGRLDDDARTRLRATLSASSFRRFIYLALDAQAEQRLPLAAQHVGPRRRLRGGKMRPGLMRDRGGGYERLKTKPIVSRRSLVRASSSPSSKVPSIAIDPHRQDRAPRSCSERRLADPGFPLDGDEFPRADRRFNPSNSNFPPGTDFRSEFNSSTGEHSNARHRPLFPLPSREGVRGRGPSRSSRQSLQHAFHVAEDSSVPKRQNANSWLASHLVLRWVVLRLRRFQVLLPSSSTTSRAGKQTSHRVRADGKLAAKRSHRRIFARSFRQRSFSASVVAREAHANAASLAPPLTPPAREGDSAVFTFATQPYFFTKRRKFSVFVKPP